MRMEFLETKKQATFSRKLIDAIRGRLEAGKQAMLLLNRRGFSSFVTCRACGERMECVNCSVTLTYHRRDRRMLCHYCNYAEKVPTQCPKCNSEYIQFLGTGSERVEEELHREFPDARIARLDRAPGDEGLALRRAKAQRQRLRRRALQQVRDERGRVLAVGRQRGEHRVRRIAQVGGDLHDPLARLRGNVRVRLERHRHRRPVHAGAAGDVLLGDAAWLHAAMLKRGRGPQASSFVRRAPGAAAFVVTCATSGGIVRREPCAGNAAP